MKWKSYIDFCLHLQLERSRIEFRSISCSCVWFVNSCFRICQLAMIISSSPCIKTFDAPFVVGCIDDWLLRETSYIATAAHCPRPDITFRWIVIFWYLNFYLDGKVLDTKSTRFRYLIPFQFKIFPPNDHCGVINHVQVSACIYAERLHKWSFITWAVKVSIQISTLIVITRKDNRFVKLQRRQEAKTVKRMMHRTVSYRCALKKEKHYIIGT